VQGAAAIMAAAAAWLVWRRDGNLVLRVAATACLTLLATPYGYSYDMVMLAAAVLMILHCAKWRLDVLLIPAWLMPGFVALAGSYSLPLAPLVLLPAAAIAVYLALTADPRDRPDGDRGQQLRRGRLNMLPTKSLRRI